MGVFLVILIVLFAAMPLFMPWLKRWAMRMMQRRAEKMFRRAMGIPDPEPSRSRKRKSSAGRRTPPPHTGADDGRYGSYYGGAGSVIPREYAEDVEFVEIKNQSEQTEIGSDGQRVSYIHESQVSDVEYTMIYDDADNKKRKR